MTEIGNGYEDLSRQDFILFTDDVHFVATQSAQFAVEAAERTIGTERQKRKDAETDLVFSNMNQQLLEQQVDVLTHKVDRDAKTELLNPVAFEKQASQRIENAHQRKADANTQQYMFMIDFDHFHEVNETLNHARCDAEVLLPAVDALRAQLRSDDLLGRFGGDEFYGLIDGVNTEQFAILLDRYRNALNAITLPVAIAGKKYLCASIGATEITDGISYDTAVTQADVALLEAKKIDGKNSTCFYNDVPV